MFYFLFDSGIYMLIYQHYSNQRATGSVKLFLLKSHNWKVFIYFDEICISIDKERNSRTALKEQFTAEPLTSSWYHMVPQAKWSISKRKLGYLDIGAWFFSPISGRASWSWSSVWDVGADSWIFHNWALEKSTSSILWWVTASSYTIQTGNRSEKSDFLWDDSQRPSRAL